MVIKITSEGAMRWVDVVNSVPFIGNDKCKKKKSKLLEHAGFRVFLGLN